MTHHVPDGLNEDLPHADPDLVEDVGLAFSEAINQLAESDGSFGPDESGRILLDALRRVLLKVERIG